MPLSNPVSSNQIIVSAAQPSSPADGLIWYELDSNQNLIETWYRKGNSWYSNVYKLTDRAALSSGNVQLYPPADARYNYSLNNLHLCILADGALDDSNYIQFNLYRRSLTNSTNILVAQTFKSLAANNVGNYNFPLNHFFLTGSSSLLHMAVYKIGSNAFNTRFSSLLDYQLIRK